MSSGLIMAVVSRDPITNDLAANHMRISMLARSVCKLGSKRLFTFGKIGEIPTWSFAMESPFQGPVAAT